MYRFIESVCVENGAFKHLEWHLKRMEQTWLHHYGQLVDHQVMPLALKEAFVIPDGLGMGTYKCRMVYGETVESIAYIPYEPRSIKTLAPVNADAVEYPFKYEDRSVLDALLAQKGQADDVLLIKHGYVTDTSFSNVMVLMGNQWLTPSTYLLNGTCRQRLLAEGLIREATIRLEELAACQEIRLINAMLDPWTQPGVKVTQPHFASI